jgi:hypothetical protein
VRRYSALPLIAAAILIAGCGDGPLASASRLRIGDAGHLAANGLNGTVRPLINATLHRDLRSLVKLPLSVPLSTPGAGDGLGTGSALLITIPDEGRFGCTANFVWRDGSRLFLGAAGHCFIPADRIATHGPAADYDASGVTVDVCVSACDGNFDVNELTGTWVRLGRVAYARQTDGAGNDVGNDFGVVEIPAEAASLIRLTMPVWGGPVGVGTLALGSPACHYGHGLVVGELFPTKARTGIGGGADADAWMGDFAAAFGDSGSGIVGCTPSPLGLRGTGAIGILTHIGVSADPESGAHGITFGTTVRRAIEMAREGSLQLALELP